VSRLTPVQARAVDRADLVGVVGEYLTDGWRLALVAAHEDDAGFRVVHVLLRPVGERAEVTVRVPRDDARLPTLAGRSYPAGRFEREVRDLFGIRPEGHPLPHRLVRHGHWPTGWYPMLRDADPAPRFEADRGSYPFLEVQGEGVYEIPVGPVHAGLIEPGHFRFSVVGETVLRMKARLWFLHRGVERLFEGRAVQDGVELAERISGDTAIGHGVAFAAAVEDALGIPLDRPALLTRRVLLELERLHNHVSDLGAIANDVGFGIVNAHLQRLREKLLRHNRALTGHRLLRGAVTIGGARLLRPPDVELVIGVAREVAEIAELALEHSVVADRFGGTAVLSREQAEHLGVLGYVARASGVRTDARCDHPWPGQDGEEAFEPVLEPAGDVRARFVVRMREVAVSAGLVCELTAQLAGEGTAADSPVTAVRTEAWPAVAGAQDRAGLGVVEAWRGTATHRVELRGDGTLARVKVVDPSFFTWPALPVALADTIVPDFPLANKSFNQSYAGNDL
jgi:Ni,Fe-hydrogenase III large subunit/Ni,Fe-hydrogenase III component G